MEVFESRLEYGSHIAGLNSNMYVGWTFCPGNGAKLLKKFRHFVIRPCRNREVD